MSRFSSAGSDERAEFLERIVSEYGDLHGGSQDSTIVDLMADLLEMATRQGMSIDSATKLMREAYTEKNELRAMAKGYVPDGL